MIANGIYMKHIVQKWTEMLMIDVSGCHKYSKIWSGQYIYVGSVVLSVWRWSTRVGTSRRTLFHWRCPQALPMWSEFLSDIAGYMSRLLALLKHTTMELSVLTSDSGRELSTLLDQVSHFLVLWDIYCVTWAWNQSVMVSKGPMKTQRRVDNRLMGTQSFSYS